MISLKHYMVAGLTSLFVSFSHGQSVVGVLYSDMNLKLAMGDSGLIDEVFVRSGSIVKQGDALVRLDNTMHDLDVRRNKLIWEDTKEQDSLLTRRTIMREKYDVAQALYRESRSVSLDELDGLRLELVDIEGRLAQLIEQEKREELDYKISLQVRDRRVLRAPISGVITQVAQRTGEWAQVGEPIVGLVDVRELFIKLNVRDSLARQLSVGTPLPVSIENIPAQTGIVDYIAPVADAASGLVEIKIKLDNADGIMRPGVKVSVDLPSTDRAF